MRGSDNTCLAVGKGEAWCQRRTPGRGTCEAPEDGEALRGLTLCAAHTENKEERRLLGRDFSEGKYQLLRLQNQADSQRSSG